MPGLFGEGFLLATQSKWSWFLELSGWCLGFFKQKLATFGWNGWMDVHIFFLQMTKTYKNDVTSRWWLFFSCHKIHQAFQFQCIHGMTSILVGFGRVGVTTIGPEKNLNLVNNSSFQAISWSINVVLSHFKGTWPSKESNLALLSLCVVLLECFGTCFIFGYLSKVHQEP